MTSRTPLPVWPPRRLGEALALLAERHGAASDADQEFGTPPDDARLGDWIRGTAERLGIDAEPVQCARIDVERMLMRAAPAIIRTRDADSSGFVVALASRRGRIECLTPDGRVVRVGVAALREALCAQEERPLVESAGAIVAAAGISGAAGGRAVRALVDRFAHDAPVAGAWIVRSAPGAPFRAQAREAGLPRLLATLVVAHGVQAGLWILSWTLLGRAALDGRIHASWLVGWGLVLLAMAPLRILDVRTGGILALRAGALLRRRLLQGALRLDPAEVRGSGAGRLLGETFEIDMVEHAGTSGGYLVATAAMDLVAAGAVLAFGAAAPLPALLLVAWMAFAALLARRLYRQRRAWTDARIALTNDTVERMVGHRTRLLQEPVERRHDAEDAAVDDMIQRSRAMDRTTVMLEALLPRGWLVVGVAGLVPLFASADVSTGRFAAALGGVLLAYFAFAGLAAGVESGVAALVAWRRVRFLWDAAARPSKPGEPRFAGASKAAGRSRPVVEAHGVVFRPHDRAADVLRGVDLRIADGERVLLDGPSGGGKSTLASILAAGREPSGGLVLQRGLDVSTLGDAAWRRGVVLAPQFHENHVFTAPVLFNALMGRAWPPTPADVTVCEETLRGLGLQGVVARMPAGMGQMLGESGWQLSHGERSRLYIARALLQDADLVVLDESFGALDPETFRDVLAYVESRARALLVVAHE